MRIIAGCARGRVITAPAGKDTRPTLDRVRESLFGILQFTVPGARVLDLFAGSGALGLEALSRGAAFAVFNDMDRACVEIVTRNLAVLGFSAKAKVLGLDAARALAQLVGQSSFDLCFLDPPYEDGGQAALEALFQKRLVSEKGIVVVEHSLSAPPIANIKLMRLMDQRRYGDTGLSFFTWAREDGTDGE